MCFKHQIISMKKISFLVLKIERGRAGIGVKNKKKVPYIRNRLAGLVDQMKVVLLERVIRPLKYFPVYIKQARKPRFTSHYYYIIRWFHSQLGNYPLQNEAKILHEKKKKRELGKLNSNNTRSSILFFVSLAKFHFLVA